MITSQAIAAQARTIVRYGQVKTVLNCRLANGENAAIWSNYEDARLLAVANGERIVVECIPRFQVEGYIYKLKARSREMVAKVAKPSAPVRVENSEGLRAARLLNGLGF
jgi:hypothetical protein